ncbi:MAG: hypothetical protein GZ094_16735 [Mariniphaga sp.]|nr:hypothetical protein [Mariniphaga sp.]
MKRNSPNDSLDAAIALLETKRDLELMQFQEHLHVVRERLKPINLITETFKAVTASPDLKNGIGKAIIGVASGFLVKKILFRKSRNPLKIVAGLALQTVASSFAAKNSDKIKSTGQKLFFTLLSKFKHNKNVG